MKRQAFSQDNDEHKRPRRRKKLPHKLHDEQFTISLSQPQSNANEHEFCKICHKYCGPRSKSLACDKCESWMHQRCLKLSKSAYECLQASSEIWICPSCSKTETEWVEHRSTRITSSLSSNEDDDKGLEEFESTPENTISFITQTPVNHLKHSFRLTPASFNYTPAPNNLTTPVNPSHNNRIDWDTSLYRPPSPKLHTDRVRLSQGTDGQVKECLVLRQEFMKNTSFTDSPDQQTVQTPSEENPLPPQDISMREESPSSNSPEPTLQENAAPPHFPTAYSDDVEGAPTEAEDDVEGVPAEAEEEASDVAPPLQHSDPQAENQTTEVVEEH